MHILVKKRWIMWKFGLMFAVLCALIVSTAEPANAQYFGRYGAGFIPSPSPYYGGYYGGYYAPAPVYYAPPMMYGGNFGLNVVGPRGAMISLNVPVYRQPQPYYYGGYSYGTIYGYRGGHHHHHHHH